jgi:hypothetical protein
MAVEKTSQEDTQMLTRRKMLQGMGAAATLGLTGCGKVSSRLNLVFHGLMAHEIRYASGATPRPAEIWVHMPTCKIPHIYCLTRPGKTKPEERINLFDPQNPGRNVFRLEGVSAGADTALPSNRNHVVIKPQGTGSMPGPGNVNPNNRAVLLRLPWPHELLSLRPAYRKTVGKPIFSGQGAVDFTLTGMKAFPLTYVFRYHDAVDAKIRRDGDDNAVMWAAPGGFNDGVNLHAEPACLDTGDHFPCLTDQLSFPSGYLCLDSNADMAVDPVDHGTGDLYGVWESDFDGLPIVSYCPKISDPGTCGQMIVDDGGVS